MSEEKFKNKNVRVLNKKRGDIFHVDDFDALLQLSSGLMDNYPNDMSDELKAKKGFKITVTVEYN